MTFAGIPRGKERADLITYLNSKSDKPAALPKRPRRPPPRAAAGRSRSAGCARAQAALMHGTIAHSPQWRRRVAAPRELMR